MAEKIKKSVFLIGEHVLKSRIMDNYFKYYEENPIVLLLHDEMFQKKWEESELKQLIDKLRENKNFEFEQMLFYPR